MYLGLLVTPGPRCRVLYRQILQQAERRLASCRRQGEGTLVIVIISWLPVGVWGGRLVPSQYLEGFVKVSSFSGALRPVWFVFVLTQTGGDASD